MKPLSLCSNGDESLGKIIRLPWSSPGLFELSVIGVVKDFHYESLHQRIRPMCLMNLETGLMREHVLSGRITGENIPGTIVYVDETWRSMIPGIPFKYSFFDDDYDALYHNEQRTGSIFSVFSILAVIIASLGIYGLSAFAAEQRTREIGIRKALGASAPEIMLLLSREFLKWAALANIVAWPVAGYPARSWLQNFAYHAPLGWDVFLLSGMLALVLALLTVSQRAFTAARANPVDSLRYE